MLIDSVGIVFWVLSRWVLEGGGWEVWVLELGVRMGWDRMWCVSDIEPESMDRSHRIWKLASECQFGESLFISECIEIDKIGCSRFISINPFQGTTIIRA